MDFQVKGKLAYISAGSTGIGEAIANLLTKEGAEVIVSARNPDTLKEKGGAWHGTVSADIATPQGVQKAVDYVLKNLHKEDRFNVIAYNDQVEGVFEARRMLPGETSQKRGDR